jgi:hypothetical protein
MGEHLGQDKFFDATSCQLVITHNSSHHAPRDGVFTSSALDTYPYRLKRASRGA